MAAVAQLHGHLGVVHDAEGVGDEAGVEADVDVGAVVALELDVHAGLAHLRSVA